MADFNVSLRNKIVHSISDVYLPIRCMTCDNLGIYGNCAIIGCNKGQQLLTGYTFPLLENSETEYFIFPKSFSLYQDLVNKMYQNNRWHVNKEEWIPTKGMIFNKEKVVYFHSSLENNEKRQQDSNPFFVPIRKFEYRLIDTVSDYNWSKYYLPLYSFKLNIFDEVCFLVLCNPSQTGQREFNYLINENSIYILIKSSSLYTEIVDKYLNADCPFEISQDDFLATLGKINDKFCIILASKELYDEELLELSSNPFTIEMVKYILAE